MPVKYVILTSESDNQGQLKMRGLLPEMFSTSLFTDSKRKQIS